MPRLAAVSVDFTNGYTLQRVTVTDSNVTASSDILCSVSKRTVTDVNDVSFVYVANVVTQTNGSFDVLVAAISPDLLTPAAAQMPNELVSLVYFIR